MRYSENLERATKRRISTEAWTDEQFREAREKDLSERTAGTWQVVAAALGSLALAALLTTAKLVEIAERQPLGTWRDRQLSVAQGVDRLSNFFSLNRPYDLVIDIRGSGTSAGRQIDTIDAVAPTTVAPSTTTTMASPASPAATSSTTTSTTTTISPYPIRMIVAGDPLRVFLAGDSQMEFLSQALSTEGGPRDLQTDVEFHISTGLARPDYFNWPAELVAVLDNSNPEAVVLFMGANDHQDMADADGNRIVRDTPEWDAEWSRRLEVTLDLLRAPGREVFWVTQPPMRDGDLNRAVERMNELATDVINARDFVTSIDIWAMFGGDHGFSARVASPDGELTSARVNDGVHLNRTAASWVAELVFAEFDRVWNFAG